MCFTAIAGVEDIKNNVALPPTLVFMLARLRNCEIERRGQQLCVELCLNDEAVDTSVGNDGAKHVICGGEFPIRVCVLQVERGLGLIFFTPIAGVEDIKDSVALPPTLVSTIH